ncbi:deaminase [Rhodopseudomonas sp. P1]|uniref:anti-phage dCTP deaminase n=1 Tax=Rhodopseudomonas sp. P1 TaxID=3434357 RepID=UPI0031FBB041
MPDSITKIKFPKLFFGFVAPIGADVDPVIDAFRKHLKSLGYNVVEIKVTNIFRTFSNYVPANPALVHKRPLLQRYESYITYGNTLRATFDDEILAATSVYRIMRKRLQTKTDEPFSRTAYLLHQFKRPEEINLLRSIYGRLFFQVSVYSRKAARVTHLSQQFASSENQANNNRFRVDAERLISDDENQRGVTNGQRVAKIFADGDVVISLDTETEMPVREQVSRFCEIIFGSNSVSPTRQEYAMYLAKAAALRSLDLSRQVGAAIFSCTGEIVALGSNEVPKANGGTYWANEKFDDRDYKRNADSNYKRKKEILLELTSIVSPEILPDTLLSDPRVRDSQFMDALEYGRILHAEMSAISDAARLGRSTANSTLYCTTFPCHMCAKHIVGAGISKVVFLEPYPKSLASDLHSDSIEIEGSDRAQYQQFPAVTFSHFFGVTPRRYRELFERKGRKDEASGEFKTHIHSPPEPMIDIKYPFYNALEEIITLDLRDQIADIAPEESLFDIAD